MRTIVGVLLFVGTQVLATGCGDATGLKFGLTGYWVGQVGTQQMQITIVERDGLVTGTGTVQNTPTGTRAVTITGTLINDIVDLAFTSSTAQPFTLHARLYIATDQYHMEGALQGSGFTGENIHFVQFPQPTP